MSYEIVKSLRVTKDKIIVNSACNNVRPLTYSDWSIDRNDDSMHSLFRDLGGRGLQPQAGANGGKWKWIMRHPCMKNAWELGCTKPDYWNDERDGEYPTREQLEENYQTFLKLIEMSAEKLKQLLLGMHPEKYILQVTEEGYRPGWYLLRHGKEHVLRCSPDINRSTQFDYYEAVEICRNYHAKMIELK